MKTTAVIATVFAAVALASCGSCQPPPPPPTVCASISIPATTGPGSGTQVLCVAPTDCREDTMAGLIASLYCSDKSGAYCAPSNSTCSGKCGGTVVSSGLTIAAGACSWDRNSECKTSSGAAGSNCTCAWTIPAGSSLACGCGCQ